VIAKPKCWQLKIVIICIHAGVLYKLMSEQYNLKEIKAEAVAAAISMAGDASLISLTFKVQLLNPKSKLLLPQVVNYRTGVPIGVRASSN
jgi:uncharacterized membrane protein YjfL (UPF0719 family)